MKISDAYDAALKTSDLAQNHLNFFIVICLAFGGWCLTSDRIVATRRLSGVRCLVAGVFVISAGAVAKSAIATIDRVNTALKIARAEIPDGMDERKAGLLFELYAPLPEWTAILGLGLTLALTAGLILFYEAPPQDAKN